MSDQASYSFNVFMHSKVLDSMHDMRDTRRCHWCSGYCSLA